MNRYTWKDISATQHHPTTVFWSWNNCEDPKEKTYSKWYRVTLLGLLSFCPASPASIWSSFIFFIPSAPKVRMLSLKTEKDPEIPCLIQIMATCKLCYMFMSKHNHFIKWDKDHHVFPKMRHREEVSWKYWADSKRSVFLHLGVIISTTRKTFIYKACRLASGKDLYCNHVGHAKFLWDKS